MITHFSELQLQTVSIQGVKQFYYDQLKFPIVYESDNEIRFQPTNHFILAFREVSTSLHPVHIAFEVPYSQFNFVVNFLEKAKIPLLKWSDGRIINHFETGRNVYFRDGDGNLLEIITHDYVKEDILSLSGALNILYLREIGFPVDSVMEFSQSLVELLNFNLHKASDNFAFAIGGTAHCVIPSKKRKWIPIAMFALPPTMTVSFGVTNREFLDEVKQNIKEQYIIFESENELRFILNGYTFSLNVTALSREIPKLLNLPFSINPLE